MPTFFEKMQNIEKYIAFYVDIMKNAMHILFECSMCCKQVV